MLFFGKFVKYFVENGVYVCVGQIFVEVEVMKMYMFFIVQEDGIVQFIKQFGVIFEVGDIFGILVFDDFSCVK